MSNRRNLLMSYLASQGKWLPYSFEYLYHSLIPQKVNKNPLLPQEYQEVEYIESSGTQYIDTGIEISTTNINLSFVGTTNLSSTQTKQYPRLFGTQNINGLMLGTRFWYGNTSLNRTATLNLFDNNTHNFKCNKNGAVIDGTSYPMEEVPTTYGDTGYIYLFNTHASSGARDDGFINAKIFSFEIYDNGTLVRNFIPCYRKSDNVIGLYDSVNGVFYTNAGTGTFAKGNDVYRLVKNKAKAVKIYGNSEVENQWCDLALATLQSLNTSGTWNDNVYSNNGVTFTIQDNKIIVNGTASSNLAFVLSKDDNYQVSPVAGKYLIKGCPSGGSTSTYCIKHSLNFNNADIGNGAVATYDYRFFLFYVFSGVQFNNAELKPQIVCLTQRYPFDTPTSLTDNRVQNIINRGYIPFNSGEIKNVDISELMSEPYNLFDGYLEQGSIDGSNGQEIVASTRCRSGYLSVLSALYTYSLNMFNTSLNHYIFVAVGYDKDKKYVSNINVASLENGLTLSSSIAYIRFVVRNTENTSVVPSDFDNDQIMFNIGVKPSEYKPHTASQTIPFKYQGAGVETSHDTMTIYNDRVEFVKDRVKLPSLGVLTWYQGTQSRWVAYTSQISPSVKESTDNTKPANILCPKYKTNKADDIASLDKIIYQASNTLFIKDSAFDNYTLEQVLEALANVPLEYPLATPQVITIPRKRLGVVDLGSLEWTLYGGLSGQYIYWATISNMKLSSGLYCSKLLQVSAVYNTADNNAISSHPSLTRVYAKLDNSYTTPTDFKNAMAGQYLFYETENEVADITDMINIEAGGTITSNWFSWVENQLVSNGNFVDTSGWYTITGTLLVSNNIATLTKNGTSNLYLYRANSGYPTITNHTYLYSAYVKLSANGKARFRCGNISQPEQSISANVWTKLTFIATPTSISTFFSAIDDNNSLSNGDTMQIKDYVIIDLTLGEIETTNINDPRIQEILRLGYIPTNTTGTLKHIDPIVLPNADMKLKSK